MHKIIWSVVELNLLAAGFQPDLALGCRIDVHAGVILKCSPPDTISFLQHLPDSWTDTVNS